MSKLTARKRKRLRKTSFAIPSKRKYPIEDKAHARNALAMVALHGTPTEKREVKAAVHKRYPSISQTTGKRKTRRRKRK